MQFVRTYYKHLIGSTKHKLENDRILDSRFKGVNSCIVLHKTDILSADPSGMEEQGGGGYNGGGGKNINGIDSLFQACDLDGSGYIDMEELSMICSDLTIDHAGRRVPATG